MVSAKFHAFIQAFEGAGDYHLQSRGPLFFLSADEPLFVNIDWRSGVKGQAETIKHVHIVAKMAI